VRNVLNRDIDSYLIVEGSDPDALASQESFTQQIIEKPELIHEYFCSSVKLAEGAFQVGIDCWMEVELIPIQVLSTPVEC
jgi:hypothetical protein